MEFQSFQKIARLSKPVVITEKLDGTNAQIYIGHVPTISNFTGESYDQIKFGDKEIIFSSDEWIIKAGSRNRWITPENDNFGFALWVKQNHNELLKLGHGRHFGEWWGVGIQRGYDLHERRFSLFNVGLWNEENKPRCCHIVPVLYSGELVTTDAYIYDEYGTETYSVSHVMDSLKRNGSKAAPGYMNPEGIIIYHTAAQVYFKKTFEKDRGKYE